MIKAAVQSKLTEAEWKDIKKRNAIKPLWLKDKLRIPLQRKNSVRRKGFAIKRASAVDAEEANEQPASNMPGLALF